jgi:hypothetical protein
MSVPPFFRWVLPFGAALLVIVFFFRNEMFPEAIRPQAPAACGQRGSVDTPRITSAARTSRLEGWAFDRARRITAIEARSGGKTLARSTEFTSRPDVTQALAACGEAGKTGFSLPIELAQIPAESVQIALFAVMQDSGEFPVGQAAVDLSLPLADVDFPSTLGDNRENRVTGWAAQVAGQVKVRLRRGETVLAETVANLPRSDVGQAFPLWPQAALSGFSLQIPPSRLPLGKGETTLEFVAQKGARLERPGPPLDNDAPLGKVLAAGGNRFVDPEQLSLQAWAWHGRGIVSAAVETESGIGLGKLALSKPHARLSAFSDPRFPAVATAKGNDPTGQIFPEKLWARRSPPDCSGCSSACARLTVARLFCPARWFFGTGRRPPPRRVRGAPTWRTCRALIQPAPVRPSLTNCAVCSMAAASSSACSFGWSTCAPRAGKNTISASIPTSRSVCANPRPPKK